MSISFKSRGMRKKKETSGEVEVIEPVLSSKSYGKRWAAWMKIVWDTDPLVRPKKILARRILSC
jgi:hypothetical protein